MEINRLRAGYDMGVSFCKRFNLKGKHALDVGAGHCAHSAGFAEFFDRVDCLDITDVRFDKKPLLELTTRASSLEFYVQNAENMTLKDKYDLVYSLSALEHMSDWRKVIKNMVEVLTDKGKLFIVISPFYYSPLGHHLDPEMGEWEHLTLPLQKFKDEYFKRGGTDYGYKVFGELNKMIPGDLIEEVEKYCDIEKLEVTNITIRLLATKK